MWVSSLIQDRDAHRPSVSHAKTIALVVRSLRDVALGHFEFCLSKLEVLWYLYCLEDVFVVMTGYSCGTRRIFNLHKWRIVYVRLH